MADRAVADYVAEVLAEFARAKRARCVIPGRIGSLDYFSKCFQPSTPRMIAHVSLRPVHTSEIIRFFCQVFFRTEVAFARRRGVFRM